MTEKTELESEIIDKISHLTHWNHHNEARLALAQAMESKKLVIAYQSIIDLGNFQYQAEYIGHPLSSVRDVIDKILFTSAKKMYSNFDEIWDSF
tara:strand:+ start:1174 stop:1455 length:282 start_codon:yes stop_codon:yes gene_type:complete